MAPLSWPIGPFIRSKRIIRTGRIDARFRYYKSGSPTCAGSPIGWVRERRGLALWRWRGGSLAALEHGTAHGLRLEGGFHGLPEGFDIPALRGDELADGLRVAIERHLIAARTDDPAVEPIGVLAGDVGDRDGHVVGRSFRVVVSGEARAPALRGNGRGHARGSARGDGVGGDAVAVHGVRDGVGKADDGHLGGRVVWLAGCAEEARAGREVDQAIVAFASLAPVDGSELRGVEGALGMDVHDRVPLFFGHVEDHAVAEVTGDVDEDIEAAELVQCGADDVFGGVVACHAVGVGDGLAAGRLDFIDDGLGRAGIGAGTVDLTAEVVDDDGSAFVGEKNCG